MNELTALENDNGITRIAVNILFTVRPCVLLFTFLLTGFRDFFSFYSLPFFLHYYRDALPARPGIPNKSTAKLRR